MRARFVVAGETYIAEQDGRGSGKEADIVIVRIKEVYRRSQQKASTEAELRHRASRIIKEMRGRK